ncbi:hypothetical protein QAD02_008524 [Eretmocerus hayati]|uniref:Uncharacterized protein n=1 Tax=Eretmocerus hayati TaxID=131215 RepID=A0ACC2N723_9HYME|nr:hypothetical protein QAD02_008524 [Eretmocerus hayati]
MAFLCVFRSDDALLDEDLGDEEYDLGNEEEEALLADDNDTERLPEKQTVIKGEEETDDVLDLGVTDALDDLEAEEENVHHSRSSKAEHKPRASKERRSKRQQSLEETTASEPRESLASQHVNKSRPAVEETEAAGSSASAPTIARPQTDLRERLREKANSSHQRGTSSAKERRVDDDDAEDAKERRNRFESERSAVPTKMNHEIPDSLENVVTAEQHRPYFRNRDRASRDKSDRSDRSDRYERSDRRSVKSRGGRYEPHQPPRYHAPEHDPRPPNQQQPHQHQHQQAPLPPPQQPQPPPVPQPGAQPPPPPQFRGGPLHDGRQGFQPGAPPGSGGPMAQPHHHMYPAHGPPGPPGAGPPQQPLPPQGPPVPGPYHHPMPPRFMDGPGAPMQPQPGTFAEPMRPPGLRMGAPRMEYGPRGPLPSPPGLGPGMSGHPRGPPGPQNFGQPQYAPPYPGHGMHGVPPDRQGPVPGQGPPSMSLAHPGPHQGPPMMPPAGAAQAVPPGFARPQPLPPGPPAQSGPLNQPPQQQQHPLPYDGRLPQQPPHQPQPQPQYEPSRAAPAPYDSRGGYAGNPSVSQYNSGPPRPQVSQSAPQQQPQQQILGVAAAPNIPVLPAGHKILINPHFKGNQVKNDVKTPQEAADSFVQALRVNASNSSLRDAQPKNQQAKSDDPFSYFSDVWQGSKAEKPRPSNSRRSYSPENNYSKSSSHNSYDSKYKSDSHGSHRDNYSEKQDYRTRDSDRYRDRNSPPRRKNDQRNYSPPRNSSHGNESHDHGSSKFQKTESIKLSSGRELGARVPPKRSSDDMTMKNIRDDSPKKPRPAVKHKQHIEKITEKAVDQEEELDPEMREYRKKMEEQKLLREKILRAKENRRKLAAMQKQNSSSPNDVVNTEPIKQDSTIAAVIAKDKTRGKINLSVVRARSRLGHMQPTERQRIVLQKSSGQEVRKVVKSNIVRVDNLAASTSEAQIRRMCQGIGSIESIQMGEGNATIVFKTQSAAMVFHKKYQRKMIDLSLIKVHLIPQIAASKASKILKGSKKD